MILYLLRHGPAADPDPHERSDASRPLTAEGRREVRKVARKLAEMEAEPRFILTSPLVRAAQTAEIVAEELKLPSDAVAETDSLKPGAEFSEIIRELRALKAAEIGVMLVGHEPDLSMLASLLISGSAEPAVKFKKTGLARIDCAALQASRCGVLRWLVTPGQLGV